MMRRIVAAVFTAVLALPLAAQQKLEDKVSEFTLPNGLHFLVVERHEAPVFFGMVRFKVGSVDEVPGITGLAHMFEHMVFKGTKAIGTKDYKAEKPLLDEIARVGAALSHATASGDREAAEKLRAELEALEAEHHKFVVPNEVAHVYDINGGNFLNATTQPDYTTYFVALPASRLELWMLMESERFKFPVLREFYKERNVVMEERRLGPETIPDQAQYELLLNTAFTAHPYRVETVGFMSDLQTITMEDAQKFYATHYVPQNAVVALVGDVNPQQARAFAEKYFGGIPKAPDPPLIRTREPEQRGEKRAVLEWDAEPAVVMGWHVPTRGHADFYPLQAMDWILSSGLSARLELALVKKGMASSAYSFFTPGERYDHLFCIGAEPVAPHDTKKLEQVIYREIERLKNEPVSRAELDRMRTNLQAGWVRGMGSNLSLAFRLTDAHLLTGSWKGALEYMDAIAAVTAEDIQRVANTYLTESNRTVVTRVKKKPAGEQAESGSGKAAKKNRRAA